MPGHSRDLDFPACCANCPYLDPFKASCAHDLRQSLVSELDPNGTCPVYLDEKTKAMQRMAENLRT